MPSATSGVCVKQSMQNKGISGNIVTADLLCLQTFLSFRINYQRTHIHLETITYEIQ